MLSEFVDRGLTRTDFVVALGGGVTGDMAGFAAASYLRGVPFIQIPTSLLAQIDSSVGGKTGVDLPQGKNLIGAFWQPSLVLIDPDTLSTLPEHFFADGMGEAIKYGCIRSQSLLERLERENAKDFLEDMIRECVDCKRVIVEHDEKEKGERMLLNFGHTLGHALEKVYGYQKLSHGEAVGIGMVLMTQASERAGITKPGTARRIANVLARYQLPVSDPAPMADLVKAACSDKKSAGSSIRLVLLSSIGESLIHTVPHAQLLEFLTGGSHS
ncbi:MAG: 3-dehydroquinate synthase, partial [Clostridium sp.]